MEMNKIIQGDAREVLPRLAKEGFVCDVAITSPPYWALRAYTGLEPSTWDGDPNCVHEWETIKTRAARGAVTGDWDRPSRTVNAGKKGRQSAFCSKCGAWKGGLGLEPSISLYIKHLVEIFDLVKAVLAPHGSLWVNLSDTYYGSGDHHTNDKKGRGKQFTKRYEGTDEVFPFERPTLGGELPAKCLSGIPERFVIAMIDQGWIYRNRIIWHKNAIPESCKDRFTVDYELLFFFTKNAETLYWSNPRRKQIVIEQPRNNEGKLGFDWHWGIRKGKRVRMTLWQGHDYYFKQQYQPGKPSTLKRYQSSLLPIVGGTKYTTAPEEVLGASRFSGQPPETFADRTLRCVWYIPSEQRFDKVHFATYPKALLRRPIDAACPPKVCLSCSAPMVPIWKSIAHATDKAHSEAVGADSMESSKGQKKGGFNTTDHPCLKEHKLVAWAKCKCNSDFRRGIVLDPFMGSGTTALVARELNKDWLGIELVPAYIELAYQMLDGDQQVIEG